MRAVIPRIQYLTPTVAARVFTGSKTCSSTLPALDAFFAFSVSHEVRLAESSASCALSAFFFSELSLTSAAGNQSRANHRPIEVADLFIERSDRRDHAARLPSPPPSA